MSRDFQHTALLQLKHSVWSEVSRPHPFPLIITVLTLSCITRIPRMSFKIQWDVMKEWEKFRQAWKVVSSATFKKAECTGWGGEEKKPLYLVLPSNASLIQRQGFCLLDRLMRQGRRSKGPDQKRVTVGVSILINPARYTDSVELIQGGVCLFVYVCVRPEHSCASVASVYICLYFRECVWKRDRVWDLWPEITQVSRVVQGSIKY